MKWRIRPSAFSRSGGKSSSRLNSVTNSSVRSRPRLSIARRRPWAWPKRSAGIGRMARDLNASGERARPGEPGRARAGDQFSGLAGVGLAPADPVAAGVLAAAGVAAAPFAVDAGSSVRAGALAVGDGLALAFAAGFFALPVATVGVAAAALAV